MRTVSYLLCLQILFLAGCASQLVVTEIGNNVEPGESINGIPFRVPKRFEVMIFEKTDYGYEEMKTKPLPITIADPDRLFALNFKSQPFSSAKVAVTVNPDNTIQEVSVTSTSTGAKTLTALGAQIDSLATVEQTRRSVEKGAETATATALLAADKAKLAADLATLQYQIIRAKSSASPVDLLKASQAERTARLNANEKARLAGRSPYFPEVEF